MDIIIIDVKKTTMLHTHDVSARRVYSLNIRSTTREECASQRQSSRRSESKHFKVPCRRNIIRLYDKLNIILCPVCTEFSTILSAHTAASFPVCRVIVAENPIESRAHDVIFLRRCGTRAATDRTFSRISYS